MRILSITAQKPNSTGSGVYLTEVVKELHQLGHEQAVIAGVYEGEELPFSEDTLVYPVYFETGALPFPIVGMSDEMPYKSTRYCDMTPEMTEQFRRAFTAKLKEAVKAFKPDLILCHHLYYLTAVVRELFPDETIYGFCHNTDLRQLKKIDFRREYIVEHIQKLDRIFVPQKAQEDQVLDIFHVERQKIRALGMGYNQNIFSPAEKPDKASSVLKLAFAGKIARKKGVESLLKSLSYLPYAPDRVLLKLAGSAGNEQEYREIRQQAKNVPYEIQFLGRLTQEELAVVYRQSDIFVLPSFFDGLPLVVIEALACGAKVVVSDLPGVKDWLTQVTPEAPVKYVKLPLMRNTDEPVEEELPAFERELAAQIEACANMADSRVPDLSGLSWRKICEKILEIS